MGAARVGEEITCRFKAMSKEFFLGFGRSLILFAPIQRTFSLCHQGVSFLGSSLFSFSGFV
jgi:hypothetical protein